MPRAKDLTGQRFGRLVAIEPTAKRYGGSVVWRCRCDCGNEHLVSASILNSGAVRSCGCYNKERVAETHRVDLTGQRFGKLVAVEPTDRREVNSIVWRCKCDCGNEHFVSLANLKNGSVTSCGCLRRPNVQPGSSFGDLTILRQVHSTGTRRSLWLCECSCGRRVVLAAGELLSMGAKSCGRRHEKPINRRFSDLAGQRFGSLLVKREAGSSKDGGVVWRCLCDCGNTVKVKAGNLVNGHTTSCGCRKGKPVEEGERFGSLVAVERVGTSDKGQSVWRCECDCGGEREATGAELRYGNVTSCGCGETKRRRAAEASGVVDGTRLSNLNGKPPKNNTSGVRGVFRNKRRQKWQAQIKFQGKNRFLGYFDDLADAAEARREAEQELFDPVLEAHGRTPTSEEEYEEALSRAVEAERESEN